MIVPSYRSYQANQVETRPSSSCSVLRARYVHTQEKNEWGNRRARIYTCTDCTHIYKRKKRCTCSHRELNTHIYTWTRIHTRTRAITHFWKIWFLINFPKLGLWLAKRIASVFYIRLHFEYHNMYKINRHDLWLKSLANPARTSVTSSRCI